MNRYELCTFLVCHQFKSFLIAQFINLANNYLCYSVDMEVYFKYSVGMMSYGVNIHPCNYIINLFMIKH